MCRVYIPINWPKASDSLHRSTEIQLPCFDWDKLRGIINTPELPWGSGGSRNIVWNRPFAQHLPRPCPASPTPSLASPGSVSPINHSLMNCCLRDCFLGTQPKTTSLFYLDAGSLLIISLLGNIYENMYVFSKRQFHTYIYISVCNSHMMEIDMSKMERQILPTMKIILTHNKRMCSSLPRHPWKWSSSTAKSEWASRWWSKYHLLNQHCFSP